LRRAYRDPLTGQAQWGIVPGPDGAIAGVHSLSQARPVKQVRFPRGLEDFEARERYSEWRFVYVPQASPVGDAGR
jgi:hypothetical protein